MNGFNNWLLRLIEAGTDKISDQRVRRHVIFSNIIYLSLPVVYAAFMLLGIRQIFDSYGIFKFDRIIVPLTIAFCLACYGLNRLRLDILSRCIFLILWPLMLHVIPIVVQNSPADYYFAFPVGLIFHAILIQVAFSSRKEPFLFWAFLLSNLVLLYFSPQILESNDLKPASENFLLSNFYYLLDSIHYWLLFNLLTYHLLRVVEDTIEKLGDAQTTIREQRDELESKNTELEQLINSLALANQSLESNVRARTVELSQKNEQLIEYAHLNAHQLRGPYARVKGLFNLVNRQAELYHDPQIQLGIIQSLDELDNVIKKIQETVELHAASD
jgi:signal transduction histidine kinase